MGCSFRGAADAAGVHYNTIDNWMRRGRADDAAGVDSPFAELVREVRKSDGMVEEKLVTLVMQAAKDGDWRAAMTLLERRRRKQWGKDAEDERRPDDIEVETSEETASADAVEELERFRSELGK